MEPYMRSSLLLVAVLVLTAYGQLIIKARSLAHAVDTSSDKLSYLMAMFADMGVLSGLAAAVLAAVAWILVIQRLDISFAYPFMALSFVLVPVGARLLFAEPLPTIRVLGILLIIIGVGINAFTR
jgi:multidrug transporter EmrE-like cation transporter